MSLRLSSLVSCIFVTMYLAVFIFQDMLPRLSARQTSTPPPRWERLHSGSSAQSFAFVHSRTPFPSARTHTLFSKQSIPMLGSLEHSSCPPCHPTCQPPYGTQLSLLPLLLLYTQLPSSHNRLLHVCLPLCNSRFSTLLQYGSELYNLLLIRSTFLSDRGPGVPESPHYLSLIPTASPFTRGLNTYRYTLFFHTYIFIRK